MPYFQLTSTLPVKTDISATLLTTLDLTDVVPGPQLDKFHDTSKDNRLQLFLTPGYDVTEVFKLVLFLDVTYWPFEDDIASYRGIHYLCDYILSQWPCNRAEYV